jgi:hypothetical protein
MDAEYFACYEGGDRKAIEDVYESLPYFDITAAFALVVEAVY